jgi:AcrR family transcriptional regulator
VSHATRLVAEQDLETKARLLNAATRLFAARGFKEVTVREICALARANVAAVNYHFGDKVGLYREVLQKAISTMQGTTDAARRAGEGTSPEDKLRAYVRVFVQRVSVARQDAWIHQLMAHEMADPTPALDLVFDEVIRPRLAYVGQIVGDMLKRPVDDDTVVRCVLSIQAQCHLAMKNPIAARLLPGVFNQDGVEELASHIAEFSLAGIRSVAESPVPAARRR